MQRLREAKEKVRKKREGNEEKKNEEERVGRKIDGRMGKRKGGGERDRERE